MDTNYHNWLEFIKAIAPDLTVLQQAPDGNPLLWVQIAGERVRIIQEEDSDFSFWIERFEGANGETGDELVVDVGAQTIGLVSREDISVKSQPSHVCG